MWHFISDHISQHVGEAFICETAKLIQQQHDHKSYVLKGPNKRYFVKLHESANNNEPTQSSTTLLQCEAEGLAAIQDTNAIKTPRVICYGHFEENHKQIEYLVMQYICFKSPSARLWQIAGEQLAVMHHKELHQQFGWRHNNWVGSTQQLNNVDSEWARFYCQHRLQALLVKLADRNIDIHFSDILLSNIESFLSAYAPNKSLLHGDLWSGNIGFTHSAPVIFDPAVYIGDREIDLAMALLFGGFAKQFFEAYQGVYPLQDGSAQRIAIYQLYPLLNHVLMFGGNYNAQTMQLIQTIQQDIK